MFKQIQNLHYKFSAWMDYNPPGALTSTGWRLFRSEFKERAPIRFWLKNTVRYKYILPIKWKYDKVRDYVRYRTVNRYHIVRTGLEPGWFDTDTKILHTCFTMLVDYVEVEKAWHKFIWDEKSNRTWCQRYMPFYDKVFPFRRPDLGLAYLDWEVTLDDPSLPPHEQSPQQARDAREQRELYLWWTKIRPARKELEAPAYSDQGLDDVLAILDDDFDHEAEDYKKHQEICNKNADLAKDWEKEDEEMLIRLIKIRKSLWT